MTPKRLLVLGAGPWQIPLIQRALARGAAVITLDNRPHNPGHVLAHQVVNCSTTDRNGVLEHAQRLRIDGIATMASDVSLPTLGHVADALHLPGCSSAVARCVTNKAAFRAFQHATPGLSAPAFVSGSDFSALLPRIRARLRPPVLFKPVDSSGSRGISRVNTLTARRCLEAFVWARQFSSSGNVCVESLVAGTDASGDGFLVNGQLSATITRKYSAAFVPIGHCVPCAFQECDLARIKSEVERTCAALEYQDGPIDFDLRVSGDRVTVIELSTRLGGNGIPALVERAAGVDLVDLNVAYAFGEPVVASPASAVSRSAGSYVFGSRYSGRLSSVASAAALRNAAPEVFDYHLHRGVGEEIPPFEHSGNSIGHVLFDLDSPSAYETTADRVAQALCVVVEPKVRRPARPGRSGSAVTAAY